MTGSSMTSEQLRACLVEMGVDVEGLADDALLISSNKLDSFQVADLLGRIEEVAGIRIPPMSISLENLDSIERILAFVKATRD